MLLVGLTGGIGAGKSTVAELLTQRGAMVLDADVIAREVVAPGTPGLAALADRFGPTIVDYEDSLDRAALADIAFADEQSRRDLEAITHPAIQQEFTRRIAAAPDDAIVVCDMPLLVESFGVRERGYDVVVVVEAPHEVRLARLEERGLARADAEARIAAQASDDERRAVATYVIENGTDPAALEHQVDTIWADLISRV